MADESPPWQSVQPIAFAFVCIDGLSGLWHVRQPALLRATSASLCCRGTCGAAGGAAAWAGHRPTPMAVWPIATSTRAALARATSEAPATGSHPSATMRRPIRKDDQGRLLICLPQFGIQNLEAGMRAEFQIRNSSFQYRNVRTTNGANSLSAVSRFLNPADGMNSDAPAVTVIWSFSVGRYWKPTL